LTGDAEAGDIALTSQPHLPHRSCVHDACWTSVVLDQALVAGVATGLPSSQAPLPVRFRSFRPVDAGAARLWKDTLSYVKHTLLADEAIATPLVLGNASRLLAAVTLSAFPNTATTGPTPHDRTDAKPVLLRRAMEYMDANAANDIGLGDVAEAVHVTPRAVQYMFRRHLETTPLQYLRRLRLHYAHQELLAGDRMHNTVTDIAARWGFAHTGRFAVLYRQTYGQSPHSTLRG
jgi:AraC-like DNA-binding protein